jgi:hypothetical protein
MSVRVSIEPALLMINFAPRESKLAARGRLEKPLSGHEQRNSARGQM